MNKEALEFYLESKNLLSQKIEEKLAEEKEGDTYSKLSLISAAHQEKQANFKENAIKFIKAHPKATENAIVGGLMGGGSELAMPAQYDITGQPSTNMSRIGKRALLGAAMGGVGGEIKSNVRGHISKLAASKEAGMLSPMLQRAGGMIAKNPRAASAVLGAGAGLASNELTGADAPVFSAVAGGALGALGGKQLLRATVNRAKPLLGKDVASGAVNVMKQNRASQLALKPPTSVNMGATQQAAAKMRPVANTQAARTLPVGKGSTNYSTPVSSLPSQTSFTPTQVASNKPQTNLPGVSFHEGPMASPAIPQKQDPMAGYRPSRSTIPQLAPQRGSMPKSTFDPAVAQTMSKLAHIMKW